MNIVVYFGGGDEFGWSSLSDDTFPRWLQAVEPTSDFLGIRRAPGVSSSLPQLSDINTETTLTAEFSPKDSTSFSLDFLGTPLPTHLREWLLREEVYEGSEILESVVLSGHGENGMRWISIFDFQEGSILVAPSGGAQARVVEDEVLRETAWQSTDSRLQFVRATVSASDQT